MHNKYRFITFKVYTRNCCEGTDNRHGPSSDIPALNKHTLPHQKVNQSVEMDSGYRVGCLFVEPLRWDREVVSKL
jgi:hypothetical protein